MDYLTASKINSETLALAEERGLTIEVEYDDDTYHYNPRTRGVSSKIITSVRGAKSFSDGVLSDGLWGNSIDDGAKNYASENGIDFADMLYITVYGYSHSGFSVSDTPYSCQWDSGVVGFIYESKKAIREEWGVKRISKNLHNTIVERLKQEIEDVDYWLNGEYLVVSVSNGEDTESLSRVVSSDEEYTSEVAMNLIAQIEAVEGSAS